jgi:uncharacterized protein
MKMRRADREVRERGDLVDVLEKADACRIAFAAGGEPYIVTLNYGFEWKGEFPILYFHCAREGGKLEAMRANPRVCFELDADHELAKGDSPCSWGMRFASIVGYGILAEVESEAERVAGLDSVMRHYGWAGAADYAEGALRATTVLRLSVSELCGKRKA